MQGELAKQCIRVAKIPAALAATSDLISTIVDMGTCQNATAYIAYNYDSDSCIEMAFWTSSSDTSLLSGTVQTATTNTVAVVVTSDDDHLGAWDSAGGKMSGLTVSSNMISSIASDCVIAVDLPNIRRYVTAQFTGLGAVDYMSIVFVGRDAMEAPVDAARTAY